MPEEEEQDPKSKPISFKTALFIVISILVVAGIWYGYYWFNSTETKISQAEQVTQKAERYDKLEKTLHDEYSRCQAFISQEEGQFGQFEYCQKFINFINTETNLSE